MSVNYPPESDTDEFLAWWERAYDLIKEGEDLGFVWIGCGTHDSYATDYEAEVMFAGGDPCVTILRVMDPRQRLEDWWDQDQPTEG
jgi:hypothetical protein